jgi:hypothetical protein
MPNSQIASNLLIYYDVVENIFCNGKYAVPDLDEEPRDLN